MRDDFKAFLPVLMPNILAELQPPTPQQLHHHHHGGSLGGAGAGKYGLPHNHLLHLRGGAAGAAGAAAAAAAAAAAVAAAAAGGAMPAAEPSSTPYVGGCVAACPATHVVCLL